MTQPEPGYGDGPRVREFVPHGQQQREPGPVVQVARVARRSRWGLVLVAAGTVLIIGTAVMAVYIVFSPLDNPVGQTAAQDASAPADTTGGSQATGALPAKDRGVAMCEQLRGNRTLVVPPNVTVTAGPDFATGVIQHLRAQFAASQYADLRDAGAQTAESMQLLHLAPTATLQENIYYLNNYANTAMGTLANACANHGVKLPYLKIN